MLTSRRTLGLAATPQAITAVEVVTTRSGHRLTQAAEMPVSPEAGFKDPALLGKALKEFLQAHHFSASRCVIGLDATYLAAREKRLPPAAAASMTDILRIAAEQDFASEGQDLMTDFVPGPAGAGPSALLVAAPRGVVEQLVAAAGEAGLTVLAVSSSALALAGAAAPLAGGGDRLMLFLSNDSAELVAQSGGAPRLLRRLSPRIAAGMLVDAAARQRYLAELEADLRRGLALSAAQAQAGPAELLVWNSAGLDEPALKEMGERLGVPVRLATLAGDLAQLGGAAAPQPPSAETEAGCRNPAPAAALAMQCAGEALPLDFLHSRLAVKRKARFGRVAIWSTVAGAALVAAIVWLVVDWQNNQREIDQFAGALKTQAPALAEANLLIAKARFAQNWYDHRPKFMECLRELAVDFPDTNIWATSLNVREDMHVTLSGKASDDQWVIRLYDRLKADNTRLADVKLPSITGRANTREVSFTITFAFAGAG